MSELYQDHFIRNILIVMIPVISICVVFLAITNHDMQINREEIFVDIYKNDSCDELFEALGFENRKIFEDQTEVKVLKHFIVENRC